MARAGFGQIVCGLQRGVRLIDIYSFRAGPVGAGGDGWTAPQLLLTMRIFLLLSFCYNSRSEYLSYPCVLCLVSGIWCLSHVLCINTSAFCLRSVSCGSTVTVP